MCIALYSGGGSPPEAGENFKYLLKITGKKWKFFKFSNLFLGGEGWKTSEIWMKFDN